MKRIRIPPRADWQTIVEQQGLTWHSEDGRISWNENAAYILTQSEVKKLCRTASELAGLIQEACAHVIKHALWSQLGLQGEAVEIIASSWRTSEFSLCGRFDFLFDADGTPKFLEYNAETALSMVETAVIQKRWLADVMPGMGQCNDLDSHLRRAWSQSGFEHVHCAWRPRHAEVEGTVRYMANILKETGIRSSMMALHRLGWHPKRHSFLDEDGLPIRCCYKIYPWHWMLKERFSSHVKEAQCNFVEPPWRLIAGSKGMLCIMSERFGDHPAILPSHRSPDKLGSTYVCKPLFGHEGRNVRIHKNGVILESLTGEYGGEESIFQALVDSPRYDGYLPQFGVWTVGHEAVAIGMRESKNLIISANSAFVPHTVECE